MKHPRSTIARAKDVAHKLVLLLAEVDGYGCRDMTHRSETRSKWHSVQIELERARNALRQLEE